MIVNKRQDLLGFSSSSRLIKRIAMEIINVLQNYKSGDIVVAASVIWLMICERFEVEPNDMLAKAERIRDQTYDSKFDHQFLALQEYFKHEL
jgi:hypothetical protein